MPPGAISTAGTRAGRNNVAITNIWQNELYTVDELSAARKVNFLAGTMGCSPFRVVKERDLIGNEAGTHKTIHVRGSDRFQTPGLDHRRVHACRPLVAVM